MDHDDDIMAGTLPAPLSAPPSSSSSLAQPAAAAAAAATAPGAPAAQAAADAVDAADGQADAGEGRLAARTPQPAAAPVRAAQAEAEKRRNKSLGLDEKKRGKRLLGGLLGTLNAFKKEERQRDASDAAKRRTQITSRIQTKLQSEAAVSSELAGKERALRAARGEVERLEGEIRGKGDAYRTRHTALRRLSGFLFTPLAPAPPSAPAHAPASSKAILDLPSPIPLGQAARAGAVPPLFYLPKELTPEQDERLSRQKVEVDQLISDETAAWVDERHRLEDAVGAAESKVAALTAELADLRAHKAALRTAAPASTPAGTPPLSVNGAAGRARSASERREEEEDAEMRDVQVAEEGGRAGEGGEVSAAQGAREADQAGEPAPAVAAEGEEVEY